MEIRKYKNIEYAKISTSEIEGKTRIDADYYEPYYLRLISKVKNKRHDFLYNLASNVYEVFKKSKFDIIEYVEISAIDLNNGAFESETIIAEEAPSRASKIVNQDDILISTVRPIRNAVSYVSTNQDNTVASSGFCKLRAYNINAKYLFAVLKTDIYRDLSVRLTTSTMYPAFAEYDLMNLPIPIPSTNFQDKIAEVITFSFTEREKGKNFYLQAEFFLESSLNLKNWEAPSKHFLIKSSLFKREVTENNISSKTIQKSGDRLDSDYWQPAVLEIIDKIKSVDYAPLHKFTTISGGFAWESEFFGEKGEGLPFVRIRDCKPTYIDNENLTTLAPEYVKILDVPQAQKGDIVVGMDGLKYFYGSLIVDPVYVNQRVCHLKVLEDSELEPEYIVFIINSKIGQTQLLRQMTIADTVGHITNVDVHNLLIPLFDKETRAKITESVKKSIEAEINAKKLIKLAKQAVEIYVEQDEKSALQYIVKELEKT